MCGFIVAYFVLILIICKSIYVLPHPIGQLTGFFLKKYYKKYAFVYFKKLIYKILQNQLNFTYFIGHLFCGIRGLCKKVFAAYGGRIFF
jgi:hypothetical protein